MPFDVTIHRGNDLPMGSTITDPALANPLSDPEAVVWFTVKRRASDPDSAALILKRTGAGVTHTSGTEATWLVSNADFGKFTQADLGERYFWEVQYKSGQTGRVKTIDGGGFRVLPNLTRATS